MSGWMVPARETVLPIEPEQRCAVCGSENWASALLLLSAPAWVQQTGWFANWFVVLCSSCLSAWDVDDVPALQQRWDLHPDRGQRRSLQEWLPVVQAMQSEPPLTRAQVSAL